MIVTLLRRMLGFERSCMFCDRPVKQVKVLVVRAQTRVSICDECTLDALETVRTFDASPAP